MLRLKYEVKNIMDLTIYERNYICNKLSRVQGMMALRLSRMNVACNMPNHTICCAWYKDKLIGC